jgi:hypothetical protein
MASNRPELLTFKQILAARQWLTEPWLRRLVYERRVPFRKVGNRLLFDLDDIDKLAERDAS